MRACARSRTLGRYIETKDDVFAVSLNLIVGQREQIWDINP